jgi:hypothetical protein
LLVAFPVLAACIVVVIVVSPTFTGVGLAYHSMCARGPEVAFLPNYLIPAVLVNSPFGGSGWGNGTIPISFPGAFNGPPPKGTYAIGFGTGALNGGSLGAFFTVNVSIYSVRNLTVLGAGQNLACSQSYSVQFENPRSYLEAGGEMLGENNVTDAVEPRVATFNPGLANISESLYFNNSFSRENSPTVSTCDGTAKSLPVDGSDRLQVWFPVDTGSAAERAPFELTFAQSFHYIFPANFGTWQVDNLSSPGGPGGGWAFSYSPCA